VDQCPNCGGYWLDAGELAIIQQEQRAAAAQGDQDSGKAPTSREVIRYLYELQIQIQAKQARGSCAEF
jgi:Zn-finger nucleic acid-binding protein